MSDVFSVTAAWSKTVYNAGDAMSATISGDNVHTTPGTTTHTSVGPVTIPVVAASGAKSTVSLPVVDVATTTGATSVHEPVLIDTTVAIVDSSVSPHTWAVSADRKSITATA